MARSSSCTCGTDEGRGPAQGGPPGLRGGGPDGRLHDVRTVGVEAELLLVAPGAGRAVAVASRALEEARAGRSVDLGERVEGELQEQQLETNSRPQERLEDLHADLADLRRRADTLARTVGARTAALGTAPTPTTPVTTPKERYQRMARVYGPVQDVQLVCGCHVHVGVESPEEGVAVLDRIRTRLPVVAALTANSPFWAGRDTGYASFRHQLWSRWPSAGPIEPLGSHAAYEDLVGALLATGAAMDTGMLYFDARLSVEYPTVEVRVADVCLDVRDTVTVAGLVRALVETAATQWRGHDPDPTPAAVVRAGAWRASRYGVRDRLVDPVDRSLAPAADVVWALFEQLGPALDRAGDTDLVQDGLTRILAEGTGADRQRAAARAADGDLAAVVAAAAEMTNQQRPV